MSEVLLSVDAVTMQFGGVTALDNVSLHINKGEILGLIGPNGAGKTTFIDAITGFTNVSSGRAEFNGSDLAGVAPSDRAKRGLVRTFQSLELFEDLTVWDNLVVMAEETKWWSFLADIVKQRRQSQQRQPIQPAVNAACKMLAQWLGEWGQCLANGVGDGCGFRECGGG